MKAGVDTGCWDYVASYAGNGIEAGDCFMMSWAEFQAASAADNKVELLFGLIYGTGIFPTSTWDSAHKKLKNFQIMQDGGCWKGTIDLHQQQKILPCFWI